MSQEVLFPSILQMSLNRSYRVNCPNFGNRSSQGDVHKSSYIEEDLFEVDALSKVQEDENMPQIEELGNSRYKLMMDVAPAFYGGIIGAKGATKRRLEFETKTEIFIPRQSVNKTDEKISIEGNTKMDIQIAYRKISLIVSSLRNRLDCTHYLGAILNYGDVLTNFINFKTAVLAENFAGIDETLFQTSEKIHLTITALVLLANTEREQAVKKLEECRQYATDLKIPFVIKLCGLNIMNDDPSAVKILYAKVEAPEFQEYANRVAKHFQNASLAKAYRDRGDVKLHMTLMNIRYRKYKGNGNMKGSETFDARGIFKKFANYDFGTVECNKISLCVVGTGGGNVVITGTLEL